MANPHPAKMSARQFGQLQGSSVSQRMQGVEHFESPGRGPRATGALTLGSTVFNFYNKDIAEERGTPNALNAKTLGQVYEGRSF